MLQLWGTPKNCYKTTYKWKKTIGHARECWQKYIPFYLDFHPWCIDIGTCQWEFESWRDLYKSQVFIIDAGISFH